MKAGRQDDSRKPDPRPIVSAAKLHVIGLLPLKNKLGARWERLSGLVHKLFRKAITEAQGPSDRIFVLDELSYAVTFGNLSLAETNLACNAIARKVCEHLFGKQVDEISVRSVIAEIASPLQIAGTDIGSQIDTLLEQGGTETVITQSVQSGSHGPVISLRENRQQPALPPIDQIRYAHSKLAECGRSLGLFPVWELRKGMSSSIFFAPFSEDNAAGVISERVMLGGMSDSQIIEIEIDLLRAIEAYAARICRENKICAVQVGVSYHSLSRFQSRIRYITALQKARFPPSSPLLIKVERVPSGAPDSRIAEMIAMLHFPNVRVIVEFQSLATLPKTTVRLGATGIGGTIPRNLDSKIAEMIAENLAQHAVAQKSFSFLDHLDTAKLITAANYGNVRFGTGTALSSRHISGLESIPDFPLNIADWV